MAGTCLVSKAFIDELCERAAEEGRAAGEAAANQHLLAAPAADQQGTGKSWLACALHAT